MRPIRYTTNMPIRCSTLQISFRIATDTCCKEQKLLAFGTSRKRLKYTYCNYVITQIFWDKYREEFQILVKLIRSASDPSKNTWIRYNFSPKYLMVKWFSIKNYPNTVEIFEMDSRSLSGFSYKIWLCWKAELKTRLLNFPRERTRHKWETNAEALRVCVPEGVQVVLVGLCRLNQRRLVQDRVHRLQN